MRVEEAGVRITRADDQTRGVLLLNAVAKDQGAPAYEVPLVNSEVTASSQFGGWLSTGSSVTRVFQDDRRVVTLFVAIDQAGELVFSSHVTYQQLVFVEREGFPTEWDGAFHVPREQVHVSGDAWLASLQEGFWTEYGALRSKVVFDEFGNRHDYEEWPRLPGEERSFTISFAHARPTARLLVGPDGAEAVLGLADHGHLNDNTDRLKAVMFGASDPEHPSYGHRGFDSRGIPVTYSTYGAPTGGGNRPRSLQDPDTVALLTDLHSRGHRIAPHSIFPGSDNRVDAQAHLPQFTSLFSSRVWTDHGLVGGARDTGLASLGWDETSDYYIMDLLYDAGIEYAWDYNDDNERGTIDQLHEHRFGFARHLTYQTNLVRYPNGEPMWFFRNADRNIRALVVRNPGMLDALVARAGVSMGHTYIAFDDREGENYEFENGVAVITDALDNLLASMQSLVNQGRLWTPLQEDFSDRYRLLLNVDVERTESGFVLHNQNDVDVPGATLLVHASGITPQFNGATVNHRPVPLGTVCWMDLPPGSWELTI